MNTGVFFIILGAVVLCITLVLRMPRKAIS